MQFDWYGATIPAGPDEVVGTLASFGVVKQRRGRYGYERGVEISQGDERVLEAFWGGVNGSERVHVQVHSDPTPEVVTAIRAEWPTHAVSRADACKDFAGAGTWRRLTKLALSVAEEHGIKTGTRGDWIGKKDGRTLYVGGSTAFVKARVYEKGKKIGALADPSWVRAEVEVRPQGREGKEALCVVPPERLWWSSQWSADMAQRLGVPELEALAIRRPWMPPSEDRLRYFLAQQYGAGVKRWGDEVGWANLGAAIDEMRARRRH